MTIFMDFSRSGCSWLMFFLLGFCFLRGIVADNNSNNQTEKLIPSNTINNGDIATPPPVGSRNLSPFKPSVAVIVGVLTTMFSITFLLLLYAKHCKRGQGIGFFYGGGNVDSGNGLPLSSAAVAAVAARKNSGVDRGVIETLPIFRFGSLRGQKDGLECAVCLTKFEPTEVLRLLPKCKHAFHVECVDTWLDAHSTCPLCRNRVHAEDILLVDDAIILRGNEPPPVQTQEAVCEIETRKSGTELISGYRRVSGRHSSAGERGNSGYLQIILHKLENSSENSREAPPLTTATTSSRRSLDSSKLKREDDSVTLGCFDHHRNRKDGLLLSSNQNRTSFEQRRYEHQIIVSSDRPHRLKHLQQERWSDLQPSDLLYLRSEMILSDSRRYSSGSRPPSSRSRRPQNHHNHVQVVQVVQEGEGIDGGRSVINTRSVSEIVGLSRFPSNYNNNNNNRRHVQLQERERQRQERQHEAGVVTRWLAWISQSPLLPAVSSHDAISRLA